MKNLRHRFERFCALHRNWGIPNLMLYVLTGTALLYVLTSTEIAPQVCYYLHFDKNLILQGQVWRLFTYVFLDFQSKPIYMILFLFAYYSISKQLEAHWGTLKFNLFYLGGILLTDIFCMITCDSSFRYLVAITYIPRYIHLSMFMAFATLHIDSGFLMCFIIPIKGWVLVLVDLGFTIYDILQMHRVLPLPFVLFPLMALLNYVLFFGKDVVNILPFSVQAWFIKTFRKKDPPKEHKTIPFTPTASHTSKEKPAYNHKCTICGRTDVSDPQLEFRYCSRCNGFHCYCEEHISNHTHI